MESELPEVYTLYNGPGPQYLIIAGTHGNESGPCRYLKQFIQEFKQVQHMLISGTYIIIPEVNPLAIRANKRHLWNQRDVNRSYPNKSVITRYLDPLLRSVDRVVDFHEAWGFNKCQPTSLGQTLYTNTPLLEPLLQKTAVALSQDSTNICMQWQVLDSLPPVDGAIDNYLNMLGKQYVLVEIAGQDDIQTCDVRSDTTAFIMEDLFLNPTWYTQKYQL